MYEDCETCWEGRGEFACVECLYPICVDCVVFEGADTFCLDCWEDVSEEQTR